MIDLNEEETAALLECIELARYHEGMLAGREDIQSAQTKLANASRKQKPKIMSNHAIKLLIELVTRYGNEDNDAYTKRLLAAEKWLKRSHGEEYKDAKDKVNEENED